MPTKSIRTSRNLYFQTCFIIAPSRETVLRYRRMISLSAPTPYDVWDRYLEIYGIDGVFPVADTPIGRLAAIASEEIQYPEIARCHAMRGAEVFVHPSSEAGSPSVSTKEIARRARAAENLAYVVSANSAALTHIPIPAESTTGMSKVVDYQGQILAEASPGGESMVAYATIDLAALRACRHKTGLTNVLVRQPLQAYAAELRSKRSSTRRTCCSRAASRARTRTTRIQRVAAGGYRAAGQRPAALAIVL